MTGVQTCALPISPDLAGLLRNLGNGLKERYGQTGQLADLEEAIGAFESAWSSLQSNFVAVPVAYKLGQQYPATAAYVIRTMLLKVGRPHTELEHAVSEAGEREAARLYSNVRWLGLAAGVSPLLGLLGTVWGMIMAFFHTANLPNGANKAEFLANGIYVALVTTFAGLAVAIPAAVLAHWFEGRIQGLFRELDEILLGLMPQLERFEGRLRISPDQFDPPERADERADERPRLHPTRTAESPKHQPVANPK